MAKYGAFVCEAYSLHTDIVSGDTIIAFRVPRKYASLVRQIYEAILGKKIVAAFSDFRKKRSIDANRYMWVLCEKIAEKLGISPKEVYRRNISEIAGNYFTHLLRNDTIEAYEKHWSAKGIGWLIETVDESPAHPGYSWVNAYYGSSQYDTKQMSRLIDNVIQDAKTLGIATETPEEIARIKAGWK